MPQTQEQRDEVEREARRVIAAIVETELRFTSEMNDNEVLTVGDFVAEGRWCESCRSS